MMDQTVNVTAKSENTFSGGDVPIAVEIIITCIYFMPWLLFLYIVVGFPLFCCFACFYKCCCPKQSYPQPVRVQPDLRSQTNAINGAAAAATATNIQKTIDQNWCTISVLPNAIVDESSDETNSTREECVVCLGPQHPRGRLVPCGHASFCYQCSSRISVGQDPRCPLCRTPIQQVNLE